MAVVPNRSKVLFLPVIRGSYDNAMTKAAWAALKTAADALGVDAIFPPDNVGAKGLIADTADVRAYWERWRGDLSDIKALIAFSADFMQERAVMDTARLLPEDVPAFLMVQNNDPQAMVQGTYGDSLCGSLSVHHNLRMLGRRITRSCRIDMNDADCVNIILGGYVRTIDGIETLRNMRVAAIGVNPDAFATTFTNQSELFRLGFSLHTYELLDLWGDVVLGRQMTGDETQYLGPSGQASPSNPIRKDDPRLAGVRERMAACGCGLPADVNTLDLMARYLLWIESTFERDGIDAGAIHCWPQVRRYFGMDWPCGFSMLANALLRKPLVCEADICHAIMAKLAWTMTGEPGVILDVNNNGWDPRVFNVFHCSQTPPNWLVDGGAVSDTGNVEGIVQPVPFTAVSAATSAQDFHATVFTGRFLREHPGNRGCSGWAFVPNFPEVLKAIEETGIHHFVAMKGNVADEVVESLAFRGLSVLDLSLEIPTEEQVEIVLPPMKDDGPCRCIWSV